MSSCTQAAPAIPHRRGLRIVAILLALLAPSSVAWAQGTSGVFPGPVNSRQLASYADDLMLSAPQRLAFEAEHDVYRGEFRELREGAMADFLAAQANLQGGLPDREAVVELLDQLKDVEGRVARLDNLLFDRLAPILTEEQRSRLPQVRLARERERYEPRMIQANFGRTTTDLTRIVREIELDGDLAVIVHSTLGSYSRRLTTLMRKQADAVVSMQLDMIDLLVDRGYADVSQETLMQDPELLQKVVAEIQTAYADLQSNVAELFESIRELNERTFRQVADILPERERRVLRERFYESSYGELSNIVAFSKNDWMSAALELESLTPDERSTLEPVAIAYRQAIDSAMSQCYDAAVAFWADFSPFDVDPDRGATLRGVLDRERERVATAQEEAEAALEAAWGVNVVTRVREETAQLARAEPPDRPVGTANAAANALLTRRQPGIAADPFLPAAIDESDVALVVRRLGLESGTIAVLEVLLDDYRAAIERAPEIEALRSARRLRAGAQSDPEADMDAALAHEAAARARALDAVRAADHEFFDAAGSVLGTGDHTILERLSRHRDRLALAGSGDVGIVLGRDVSHESRVDIVAVLLDAEIGSETLDELAPVLDEYETAAMDEMRRRYEARLAMQRAADTWTAELSRASREDLAAVVALQVRYRNRMREPAARLRDAEAAIAALNGSTLDRIVPDLPEDVAFRLRSRYERDAFPTVFADPACVLEHLGRALALPDLVPEQRSALMSLAGEYRPEYDRLTREMMDSVGLQGLDVVGIDAEAMAEWQRHQQEVSRLRFDRNELDASAISRLRTILGDAQLVAIGGLPEPLGEEEFSLFR